MRRKLASCEHQCRVKLEEILDIFSRTNKDRTSIMKFLWCDIQDVCHYWPFLQLVL